MTMPNTFVSVDVETANENMASICQIGIAKYVEGALAGEWVSYVNPEEYFSEVNVRLHNITPEIVKNEPLLPEVLPKISELITDSICVIHTDFDRLAFEKAFTKYELSLPSLMWLDSAKVAREVWEDCAQRGYGLVNLANKVGYQFNHHHALEDAKAAGYILLAALQTSKTELTDWMSLMRPHPYRESNQQQHSEQDRLVWVGYDPETGESIYVVDELFLKNSKSARRSKPHVNFQELSVKRDGNPEGSLFGQIIVFTGNLQMSRSTAADLASKVGCQVAVGVTKKTTLLVVGDQDMTQLAGKEKSSKQLKAEDLIAKGHPIKILSESDFMALVSQ